MRKGGPPGGGAEPPPHPRPASVTPHPTHPSPAPTAVDTAPTLQPSLHDACPEATCAELGLGSRAHGSSTVCGETVDAPVLGDASVGAKRRGQARAMCQEGGAPRSLLRREKVGTRLVIGVPRSLLW